MDFNAAPNQWGEPTHSAASCVVLPGLANPEAGVTDLDLQRKKRAGCRFFSVCVLSS
jgi:hypothetical protein